MNIIKNIDDILDILSLSDDRNIILEKLNNPNNLSILGKLENGGYSLLIKHDKDLSLLLFNDKLEIESFVLVHEYLDLKEDVSKL